MRPQFTNLRKCLVCHPAELVFKAFQPQNKQELCCVMPNKQCARSVPGRNLGKFAIVSKQSSSVTWKLSLIQKLSNQFSKLLSGFSCYSCELFHRTQHRNHTTALIQKGTSLSFIFSWEFPCTGYLRWFFWVPSWVGQTASTDNALHTDQGLCRQLLCGLEHKGQVERLCKKTTKCVNFLRVFKWWKDWQSNATEQLGNSWYF